jgi:hypothetical protein
MNYFFIHLFFNLHLLINLAKVQKFLNIKKTAKYFDIEKLCAIFAARNKYLNNFKKLIIKKNYDYCSIEGRRQH